MLHPNASSSSSRRRASRGRSPSPAMFPISSRNLSELSEVPCYTCRRRHVVCDRTMPQCAKCAKKGVACLGYQKPLRWAEGVAVRGKLKGKAQPVIEDPAQVASQNPLQKAESSESQTLEAIVSDLAIDESALIDLLGYHNTVICLEGAAVEPKVLIDRPIASVSPEDVHRLPREILECILALASVHRALRNPESRESYHLALESKSGVYGRLNTLFHNPPKERPELIYCYSILMLAMDIFEYGHSRWRMHLNGVREILGFLGGVDYILEHAPYLKLCLLEATHSETLMIASSHIPLTSQKLTTRHVLEFLCRDVELKTKFFNPCPTPLTLVLWDTRAVAMSLLSGNVENHTRDLAKREIVLLDALTYQPSDWVEEIQQHYQGFVMTDQKKSNAILMATAWKNATTILVLRYLFFGRADESNTWYPEIPAETFPNVSPYPSPRLPTATLDFPPPGRASTGSSTLSVPGSPHVARGGSNSNLYGNRYRIHNEAFAALYHSLSTLSESIEPDCLRYILLPVVILSLVTTSYSDERELCNLLLARFKDTFCNEPLPTFPEPDVFSRSRESSPMPPIRTELDLDLPWQALDSFSAMMESSSPQSAASRQELSCGAVEWNWWDMLYHLQLDLAWTATAGTSHLENGPQFWAFKAISAIITNEAFETWARGT